VHALSSAEIRDAFIEATDLWFASDSNIQVRPIRDYIINAIRFLSIEEVDLHIYDRTKAEIVYIVDTDGVVYSNADAYDPELAHGNIFDQELAAMRSSIGYQRSVEACNRRMLTCNHCDLHGACSGYFLGEATPEERNLQNARFACLVARPVQEYILERLREPELFRALTAKSVTCELPDLHPAIEAG
jgi:uncharacterized protein